jgi:hypothetical protein
LWEVGRVGPHMSAAQLNNGFNTVPCRQVRREPLSEVYEGRKKVGMSTTAKGELKGRPVGSDPTFSKTLFRPSSSIASASVNTFRPCFARIHGQSFLDGTPVVDRLIRT